MIAPGCSSRSTPPWPCTPPPPGPQDGSFHCSNCDEKKTKKEEGNDHKGEPEEPTLLCSECGTECSLVEEGYALTAMPRGHWRCMACSPHKSARPSAAALGEPTLLCAECGAECPYELIMELPASSNAVRQR